MYNCLLIKVNYGNFRKMWNMKCQNPGWRIEVLLKVVSLYNFIIGTYFGL